MKVLVVDDDVVVGMALSIQLPDVELLEAGDARSGYQLAQEHQPDVVIVDRRLPEGDGLDLVRRLRQTFATSRTPILVLTAGHDEAHRAEVTRAGADDYLAKPFEPDELMAVVSALVAMPDADRKQRRVQTVDRLRHGQPVDPLPAPTPAATASDGREADAKWWRRRR